jgi:site-specific DNA recombinase
MRVIGAVRLSVVRDENKTMSPERQRAAIEAWAASRGHVIVGWAEDLNVSGAVAPADRPELGAWLKRTSEWDCICAAKPDRISRSLRDFLNFDHDLRALGKSLVSLDPEIDTSTSQGRMMAGNLLNFAEYEREMIKARVSAANEDYLSKGHYVGGQVPFGYDALPPADGKGWIYRQDPEYAPVVREIVERVLRGESMRQVAIWLNETGIPTGRNVMRRKTGKPDDKSVWHSASIKELLMSPSIAGMQVKDGQPFRGPDGIVVQRCEGIIDAATWEAVKATVTGRARSARANANPLLGVIFCALCQRPMHGTSGIHKGRRYSYYKCRDNMRQDGPCEAKAIPAGAVEETLADELLGLIGDVERVERLLVPAEDHAEDLALTEEAIAYLRADRYEHGLFRGAKGATEYTELMGKLEAKRDHLASLPSRPATHINKRTGQTYREYWEGLMPEERRQFMLNAGIKALVGRLDQLDPDTEMLGVRKGTKGAVILWSGPAIEELRELAEAA